MFIASKTAAAIAKTIKSFGVPITITTAAGSTIKTVGVFASSKKNSDASDMLTMTSPLTVGSSICYIPAPTSSTKKPEVGDNLTGADRSYSIKEVESYCPGNVIIALKLTLE